MLASWSTSSQRRSTAPTSAITTSAGGSTWSGRSGLGDRLGGHLVQGHVDGVGAVRAGGRTGRRAAARPRGAARVARVSVPLGSITVDGVSLTVNAMPDPGVIQISLIPFTLQHTTLGERRPGTGCISRPTRIGKYVDRAAAAAPWRIRDRHVHDHLRHHRAGDRRPAQRQDRHRGRRRGPRERGRPRLRGGAGHARDDQLHDPARARPDLPRAHRASAATSWACRR